MTTSADWAITPELIEALKCKDTVAMTKVQRRNEMGNIEYYFVPAYLMKK